MSEKDAHLAWLEVTGEGNVHTKGTIERLRRERRELLQRMKEEVGFIIYFCMKYHMVFCLE